jgi:pSer/pThr/pTyr-binding forkhead associated (FHA) protein
VSQDVLVIGRGQECDLVIDNLGVSRKHAEIRSEGSVLVLHDLRSGNGTFVNGRRVTQHNLNDSDGIAIGKFDIEFQLDRAEGVLAPHEPETNDDQRTPRGDFTLQLDSRVLEQRQRDRASKLKAYLILGAGKRSRRKTVMLDRPVFAIGKERMCNLQVGGFFTARKHCLILRSDSSFRLVDTSQRRRTYLNETSIDDERLKDGDVIRVGRSRFEFRVGLPHI